MSTAVTSAIRVLVVGIGNMGRSHASAYGRLEGAEVVGTSTRLRKRNLSPYLCARISPGPNVHNVHML